MEAPVVRTGVARRLRSRLAKRHRPCLATLVAHCREDALDAFDRLDCKRGLDREAWNAVAPASVLAEVGDTQGGAWRWRACYVSPDQHCRRP